MSRRKKQGHVFFPPPLHRILSLKRTPTTTSSIASCQILTSPLSPFLPPSRRASLLPSRPLPRHLRSPPPAQAVAADLTQGVQGATPHRLSPRKPKSRPKRGGYAVFCGRATGAFRAWTGEAELLVKGVSNSVHQGYTSFELAQAAYDYALQRGWTRTLGTSTTLSTTSGPPLRALPTPVGLLELPNALHGDSGNSGRWYTVYCGISPGVYASSLECTLNTLGLKCAVFDSSDTKDQAIAAFQRALADGRVHDLRPIYPSLRLRLKELPPAEQEPFKARARDARARYKARHERHLHHSCAACDAIRRAQTASS
ncbi:hypothetical protein C8R46DRAFT_1227474 [Mycena filopes]|nr:hypothetical protein C8R46DRAFT_1227474 [Mycena filopes]